MIWWKYILRCRGWFLLDWLDPFKEYQSKLSGFLDHNMVFQEPNMSSTLFHWCEGILNKHFNSRRTCCCQYLYLVEPCKYCYSMSRHVDWTGHGYGHVRGHRQGSRYCGHREEEKVASWSELLSSIFSAERQKHFKSSGTCHYLCSTLSLVGSCTNIFWPESSLGWRRN